MRRKVETGRGWYKLQEDVWNTASAALPLIFLYLRYTLTRTQIYINKYIYMLPPEWIFQPDLFRLAQISPAEWNQG